VQADAVCCIFQS